MSDYRLYSVDGAGKIVAAEWLHARTDDEALDFARSLNKRSDCELWKRTKFVHSISASAQKERPLCE